MLTRENNPLIAEPFQLLRKIVLAVRCLQLK